MLITLFGMCMQIKELPMFANMVCYVCKMVITDEMMAIVKKDA